MLFCHAIQSSTEQNRAPALLVIGGRHRQAESAVAAQARRSRAPDDVQSINPILPLVVDCCFVAVNLYI